MMRFIEFYDCDLLSLQEGRDKRFLMERLLADAQKKQAEEDFPNDGLPSSNVLPVGNS